MHFLGEFSNAPHPIVCCMAGRTCSPVTLPGKSFSAFRAVFLFRNGYIWHGSILLHHITRSWPYCLAAGIIVTFLGLLLLLEPVVSLRLALYSLGALAVVVAAIFLAIAALLSRSGGLPFFLPLVIGVMMIGVALAAFFWPGVFGGILATIAGAVLIVGGLGTALSGLFSPSPASRKVLFVLSGTIILAVGLLVVLRSELVALVITRIVGAILLCLGLLLLAQALYTWLAERRATPEWTGITLR